MVSFTQENLVSEGQTILTYSEARDDGVAMASAGTYANHLHFGPCQHPITQFLQARCSSLCPTNSVKALKTYHLNNKTNKIKNCM